MRSVLIIVDNVLSHVLDSIDGFACALRRLDSVADDIKSAIVQLAYEPAPHGPYVMAVRHLKSCHRGWALSNRPRRLPDSYG